MKQEHNLEFFVALFFKLVALVLGTVLIYWLILMITGHSPTMDQAFMTYIGINSTIILTIAGFMFKIQSSIGNIKSDLSGLKSEFRQYAKYNDRRVSEIAADLKNHIASHN